MSKLKTAIAEADLILLGVCIALVVIGILSIYSSGVTAEGILVSREYVRQIIWAVSGFFLLIAFASMDYKRYKDYSFFIYLALMAVLIYTRFFGRVVNGARSWIGVGDIGVQPSEFAKIAAILFLAHYLEDSEYEGGFRRLGKCFLIILVPVGLILSQPDFGTSLVFFPILITMIFVAGLDRRYILFLFIWGLLTSVLTVLPFWERYILDRPTNILFILYQTPYAYYLLLVFAFVLSFAVWGYSSFKRYYYFWIAYITFALFGSLAASILAHKVLKEYQIMRLIVFLDPSIDPRGSGWNIIQSITAIGSGGFSGKGFLNGTQSHYRYIPQQSTDFIFSIVAEEWGFVGSLFLFGLFLLLLVRCIVLMRSIQDRYARYVTAGIFGMFFFHFMINSGMAMGIMPITGIPLFFLSYGGSSLWTALSAVGILLGISIRRYRS